MDRNCAEMAPKFGTEIFGTEIRDRNFWGPKFGTEIKGLESVKSIGNMAISRPKLRTEISFPKSVENQGKY